MLDWLDTDRERAGSKYEAIRLRLIKIFTCRGCQAAEELADETINRVIARIVEIANGYQGDPALYFYGVAQKVFLEDARKSRGPQAHVPMDSPTVRLSTQAVVFVEDIEPASSNAWSGCCPKTVTWSCDITNRRDRRKSITVKCWPANSVLRSTRYGFERTAFD